MAIQFPTLRWLRSVFGRIINGVHLSEQEAHILTCLIDGHTLKSHRDIDGNKQYTLHALNGDKQPVNGTIVLGLRRKRLLETNQKFPAATFLLTGKGRGVALELTNRTDGGVMTAKDFVRDD